MVGKPAFLAADRPLLDDCAQFHPCRPADGREHRRGGARDGEFRAADLRLVAPRDGWPNPAAETMSAGALPDVVKVTVFERVEDAIADCGLVLATTARPRGMEKPVLGAARPSEDARDACADGGAVRRGARGVTERGGGAERCDPVLPGGADVCLPEPRAGCRGDGACSCRCASERLPPPAFEGVDEPATREELVGMMEHFEEELDRAGFFSRTRSGRRSHRTCATRLRAPAGQRRKSARSAARSRRSRSGVARRGEARGLGGRRGGSPAQQRAELTGSVETAGAMIVSSSVTTSSDCETEEAQHVRRDGMGAVWVSGGKAGCLCRIEQGDRIAL